jgi:hypothetical protein
MPTQRQLEFYAALHARFGRTAEFRAVADGCDFSRLNSAEAYAFIANLIDATQRWRFIRLPRYAGLPRTAEERRRNLKRALREERHARLVCPDDVRETWSIDNRPSAMGTGRSYFEAQDELKEAVEMDQGFFRALPTHVVRTVVQR